MKTLIILFTILFTCLTYSQDSTFVKNLDKQIAEKDSIINHLQAVIIKDAFEKNISVQIGDKKLFFRDEVIKLQQLEEMRELYFKKE
jgi:hypothetical protein